MRVAFGMLSLLAWTAPAPAEDNPACAKYESPLAYNACLAKLGPKAGAAHASGAPVYDSPGAPSRASGLVSMVRNKRGRVEAVFTILPRK
jgi:hypothetical protein